MADLSVTIGGDSSEFDRDISQVEGKLRALERRREARVRIGADIGDLDRRISETNTRLLQLRTTATQTGQAMQTLSRSTANGGNTLMQFSRIAQDAPFGIMGIGNNLTATAEAFGHLSRQSGGAGAALRAVGQSLLGSGGILLAVSLVTSALTYMSQKGLTLGDVLKKLTGSFDDAKKAMSDINAEAAKNAAGQTASVGAYVDAAKNINLSMSDRLIAVRKLQDEYPGYFGNLTKEQILNGDVAGAVREVSKALIQKARAAALSGKLAELAEQEFKLREKELEAVKAVNAAVGSLNKSKNQFQSGGGVMGATASSGYGRLAGAKGTLQDIQDELRSVLATQHKYTAEIEKSVAASLKLEDVKDKKKAKAPDNLQSVSLLKPVLSSDKQTDKLLKMFRDNLSEDLNKLKTAPIPLNIPIQTVINIPLITEEMKRVQGLLNDFNAGANDIIKGSIADTFSSLGAIIGEGIASGGNILESVGQVLLGAFGGLLTSLGKLMIELGLGLLLAKKALSSLNPYLAIAGGVALVAVGAAFSSKSKALGSNIGGGSAGGATSGGSTGASYSSPGSSGGYSGGSSSGGGTVIFEISGQSLIGVLSNTMDKNTKLGGSLGLA